MTEPLTAIFNKNTAKTGFYGHHARYGALFDSIGSPMEAAFLTALIEVCAGRFVIETPKMEWDHEAENFMAGRHRQAAVARSDQTMVLAVQAPIDSYRIDFLLTARSLPDAISMAVEIDGHDFHDRTKEQASRDRRRDRALLQKYGISTLRFTGSEVFNSATDCAEQAVDVMVALRARRMWLAADAFARAGGR